MRFSFSVILVCFFIFSCKIDDKKSDIIKEDYFLAANQSHPTYSTFKSTVASEKARLKKRSALKKSEYFYRLINEDIYKYWNGTTWILMELPNSQKMVTLLVDILLLFYFI